MSGRNWWLLFKEPTCLVEIEAIDQLEIFEHIRDIKDPEHPYSLEELKVITEDAIEVDDKRSYVRVTFTPTVEHCSMATVIGLCLGVKFMRSLPPRYKVDIRVAPGTHATEAAVNKAWSIWSMNALHPLMNEETGFSCNNLHSYPGGFRHVATLHCEEILFIILLVGAWRKSL